MMFSLPIMVVSNGDEDGSGVDGDGSEGNSPSRQGVEQSFCPLKLGFDGGGVAELFVEDDRLI